MEHTLAVFGVTGRTGRALAAAAHAREWIVRGFARPSAPDVPGVALVRGYFDDRARVADTVSGAAAVCCVIGPRPPYAEVFCARATVAIIEAMRSAACPRIVCLTGAMVGAGNRSIAFNWLARMIERRQPQAARDRREQERIVVESGLCWTLVKPPRLTSGPARHHVVCGPSIHVGLLSSISRADLADFMLDCIERRVHVGARVFVRS